MPKSSLQLLCRHRLDSRQVCMRCLIVTRVGRQAGQRLVLLDRSLQPTSDTNSLCKWLPDEPSSSTAIPCTVCCTMCTLCAAFVHYCWLQAAAILTSS